MEVFEDGGNTLRVLCDFVKNRTNRYSFPMSSVNNLEKLKMKVSEDIGIPGDLQIVYDFSESRVINCNEEYLAVLKSDYIDLRIYVKGTRDVEATKKFCDPHEHFRNKYYLFKDFHFDYSTTVSDFRNYLDVILGFKDYKILLNKQFLLKNEDFVVDLMFMENLPGYSMNQPITIDFIVSGSPRSKDLVYSNRRKGGIFNSVWFSPIEFRIYSQNNLITSFRSPYKNDLLTLPLLKQKIHGVFGIPSKFQLIYRDGELLGRQTEVVNRWRGNSKRKIIPEFFSNEARQVFDFELQVTASNELEFQCKRHGICMLRPQKIILSQHHHLFYYFTEGNTFKDLYEFVSQEVHVPVSSIVFFIDGQYFYYSDSETLLVKHPSLSNGSDVRIVLSNVDGLNEICAKLEVSVMKSINLMLKSGLTIPGITMDEPIEISTKKVFETLAPFQFGTFLDLKKYLEAKYGISRDNQVFIFKGKELESNFDRLEKLFYNAEQELFYEDVTLELIFS